MLCFRSLSLDYSYYFDLNFNLCMLEENFVRMKQNNLRSVVRGETMSLSCIFSKHTVGSEYNFYYIS